MNDNRNAKQLRTSRRRGGASRRHPIGHASVGLPLFLTKNILSRRPESMAGLSYLTHRKRDAESCYLEDSSNHGYKRYSRQRRHPTQHRRVRQVTRHLQILRSRNTLSGVVRRRPQRRGGRPNAKGQFTAGITRIHVRHFDANRYRRSNARGYCARSQVGSRRLRYPDEIGHLRRFKPLRGTMSSRRTRRRRPRRRGQTRRNTSSDHTVFLCRRRHRRRSR